MANRLTPNTVAEVAAKHGVSKDGPILRVLCRPSRRGAIAPSQTRVNALLAPLLRTRFQLLRLDLDLLQHLAPLVLLGAHEARELLARRPDRAGTLRGEALLHEVRLDEARDLGIEPVDDRLGRACRRDDAEP